MWNCEEKQQQSQPHCDELLHRLLGGRGGDDVHAHGAEEEGDGLHLEGTAANERIEQQHRPLCDADAAEAQKHIHAVFRLSVQQEGQTAKALQKGQQQHIGQGIEPRGGPGPGADDVLLQLRRDGLQMHGQTAQVDLVFRLDGADTDTLSVDENTGEVFEGINEDLPWKE